MKKIMCLFVCGLLTAGALTGCGSSADTTTDSGNTTTDAAPDATGDFDASSDISVVSREDGSGTRGAFIELFGVEEKDANGDKVDYTTDEAIIANSTEIVMTTVAGDDYAIGYSSLGSLNDTVKAVKIDGAEPTADNINNGSYTISRPFNIATKGDVSDVAQDFINYILSDEGQAIVEQEDFIQIDASGAYKSNGTTGKTISVAGSSSVTPVMQVLAEKYEAVSGNKVEVNQSDSSTGVSSAIDGTCDIGMASRELKDSETSQGVVSTVIAVDGIAVIVNSENTVTNLTLDQVGQIYKGELTEWSQVTAQ